MVPEGWQRKRLLQITEVIDCKHRTPKYVSDGVPIVSPGDISWGPLMLNDCRRVSHQDYDQLMDHCSVQKGDIVFGRNQSVGISAYVDSEIPFALGQDTVLIQPGNSDKVYVYYILQSENIRRQIHRLSGGSTFSRINLKDIRKMYVDLPLKSEQTKIAQILSTWDKAIETTEKLIENSKAQKKALMQQLLTGKKRFPGCKTEWKECHLNEIASVLVSNVDKKTHSDEEPVLLCNYTDVYYNNYITRNISFMEASANQREVEKFALKYGDVVVTKDSESPDDIAIPALIREDLPGVLCGYHLAIIRPDPEMADGGFLNSLFALARVRYYFFTLANGATRFGLSIGSIKNSKFTIPDIHEQRKIAEVLMAQDDEIINLNSQLDLLVEQKKALMQQLLTGKRRVKLGKNIAAESCRR